MLKGLRSTDPGVGSFEPCSFFSVFSPQVYTTVNNQKWLNTLCLPPQARRTRLGPSHCSRQTWQPAISGPVERTSRKVCLTGIIGCFWRPEPVDDHLDGRGSRIVWNRGGSPGWTCDRTSEPTTVCLPLYHGKSPYESLLSFKAFSVTRCLLAFLLITPHIWLFILACCGLAVRGWKSDHGRYITVRLGSRRLQVCRSHLICSSFDSTLAFHQISHSTRVDHQGGIWESDVSSFYPSTPPPPPPHTHARTWVWKI